MFFFFTEGRFLLGYLFLYENLSVAQNQEEISFSERVSNRSHQSFALKSFMSLKTTGGREKTLLEVGFPISPGVKSQTHKSFT